MKQQDKNSYLKEIKSKLNQIKRTTFGISIPELKKFAQKIAKEDYKKFVESNDYSTFELKLLHAFVLGYTKDEISVLIKYFEDFIPQVDHWAVNDSLCQSFKICRKHPDTVWKFLMKYKKSTKEFESRIVSVMLLSHYLDDNYIDKVIDVLNSLNTDDYYSQMGVAWAIATIMGKYPQKCISYLDSNECQLDITTYKKSIRKIQESFRVSDDVKLIAKQMKR